MGHEVAGSIAGHPVAGHDSPPPHVDHVASVLSEFSQADERSGHTYLLFGQNEKLAVDKGINPRQKPGLATHLVDYWWRDLIP